MALLRPKTDGEGQARNVQESPHDHYFELCALATTGTLTDQEWNLLKVHLSQCRECSELIQKYREIARTGMPLLMPEESVGDHRGQELWTPEVAKGDLFDRIARGDQVGWSSDAAIRSQSTHARGFWGRLQTLNWSIGLRYGVSVAVGVLIIASVYQFGIRKGQELVRPGVQLSATEAYLVKSEMEALQREKASLDEQVIARDSEIATLRRQIQRATADLAKLSAAEKEAEQKLQQRGAELSQANARTTSVAAERDAVSGKLEDAQASLASMKAAFEKLREQRAADLAYTATLETRIGDLSTRLKKQDELSAVDTQLLTSDRDIRELMGARDLYIADVFDVDPDGRTQKPFGRVFYTRAKSLIFYAFDLDKQRGVRNVSTFQAWGRRGLQDIHPVNMGIFYLDNETNRRWVLKFDDPETLARIDTVFVTVEPKGGSQEPRGKPLLIASLRSQPNHP